MALDVFVFCLYICGMTTNSRMRRGRPRKGSDQKKEIRLDIRLQASEKDAFREAAEVAGLDLSAWIRERLRWAAARELGAASRSASFLSNGNGR
jgi:hypothetical protein